jgi:pimeloyl-ACP methyl ester carboxylesterase
VSPAIETRQLFTLDGLGDTLYGTYHVPCDRISGKRTGVLILTGLYTSRAADGDAAIYWAESLAVMGYPAFRIDLPGAGDSRGNIPARLLSFIDAGGFRERVAALVKQLCVQFNLTGVVILGHCAGATTALFGATACSECQGAILLAPYFHLSQALKRKARRVLIEWATRNPFGGYLSNLYLRFTRVRSVLRRDILPKNANLFLLDSWKELGSAGLPILVLKAPSPNASGPGHPRGEFDYLKYVAGLAGERSRIQVEMVEGAHHTFANHVARAKVRQYLETWLTYNFPIEDDEPAAVSPLCQTAT